MKELITTLATTPISEVGTGENDFSGNLTTILNAIVGILGVTYMTSSGDASKVKKAKDTILYGIIGLIVAALAFAVVNFVISNVLGSN